MTDFARVMFMAGGKRRHARIVDPILLVRERNAGARTERAYRTVASGERPAEARDERRPSRKAVLVVDAGAPRGLSVLSAAAGPAAGSWTAFVTSTA
jgi:hypothetical protein